MMIDGNDSLRPGLGGHPEISPRPGLSPFTLASFLFQEICHQYSNHASCRANVPVFCLYVVLVPGESRGTWVLLVTVHSGKNWRKHGRGQTTGPGGPHRLDGKGG